MRRTYAKSGLTREELTNLGNYNYGLTGASAGYSSSVLHRMAGFVQVGTGKFKLEYGWGMDNPKDAYWINRGIEDYKAGIWK